MKKELKYILPSLALIFLTCFLVVYFLNLSKLPSKEQVAKVLNSYLSKLDNQNALDNERYFTSSYISQIKKEGDSFYIYALIAIDSYKADSSIVNVDTNSNLYRFTITYENKEVKVLTYDVRGDGDNYLKDQKRLFPNLIYTKLHFAENNGTLTKLHQENKKQAEEYYQNTLVSTIS